jgi:hypothetical protein
VAGHHEEQPQAGASGKREAPSETDQTPEEEEWHAMLRCVMRKMNEELIKLLQGFFAERTRGGRLRGIIAPDGERDEKKGEAQDEIYVLKETEVAMGYISRWLLSYNGSEVHRCTSYHWVFF